MPEVELISLSRQADQAAISELFRRHYPASLRLASGILRDTEDAQDAVQGAYFLAFSRLHNFRGDASFKTWISRIVVNCCLLQLREARRRITWVQLEGRDGTRGPDNVVSPLPNPEKYAWGRELTAAFSNALANLPKHLRDTYTLFTDAEMSLQDVASTMGLSLSATKTRIFRARARLRTSLQPVWSGRHARSIAR